ncbi:MAG: hypothetical protein A4E54_01177 [Pelotomaculum sp. PtaB.Bin117]|nr:MAG: hypothetical protein A4E54_01177 [Pelotomaculum sp. PtaB.Bin117]
MSLNRYTYVQGNPVLSVDPLGLCENRGSSIGTSVLNGTQLALDVAGLIPGVGEAADAANALIYIPPEGIIQTLHCRQGR